MSDKEASKDSHEGLESRVLTIISESPSGISFGNVLDELGDVEQAPSSLRRLLAKLEDEKKIISFPETVSGEGRPKNLYKLMKTPEMIGQTTTRSVVSEQEEQREGQREGLLRNIIENSAGLLNLLPPDERDSIYLKAAQLLLKEDPRELLRHFAAWLAAMHQSECEAHLATKDRAERQKRTSNINVLEYLANLIFHRMLGVPTEVRTETGAVQKVDPPFRVRFNFSNMKNESAMNEKELQKYLSFSVLGNSVVEVVDFEKTAEPFHMGGTDASRQSINLSAVLPWQIQHHDLTIVTSVGVRYDIFKLTMEKDTYPDPKVLAQLERKQAIDEGLLIPPDMLEETMEGRIKEAAMDLRQYYKDNEITFLNSSVDIHFRDGRIFPLEHRFGDAINYGFHGDIVRRALRAFAYLVNQVGSEEGRVLLCGFVKRAAVDVMAPLVLWYIGFGSAPSNGNEPIYRMTLSDYLRTPERSDHNEVVNRIFGALHKTLHPGQAVVTFRMLRRFQSMAESPIANWAPTLERETWLERLSSLGHAYEEEGRARERAKEFALLCSRASILTFYTNRPGYMDPSFEPNVIIPRIEILAPYVDLGYDNNKAPPIATKEREYVRRTISVLSHEKVLDVYPEELLPFKANSPDIFLAPVPVCEAHNDAKEIGKIYAQDFMELLAREAKIYWVSYRTRQGKS